MKHFVKTFLITTFLVLIIFVFVYLMIAFVKAEVNPFKWDEPVRAFLVFIWFCATVFAPLLFTLIKDETH